MIQDKHIDFLMSIAELAANQSHAVRLKVGGVITDRDYNFIAYGYNGTPRGMDNCCEDKMGDTLVTKPIVIHAEANLVAHAARRGISVKDGAVFLTHSPCVQCAALLHQVEVREVYFREKFRTFDQMLELFYKKMTFIQL